MREFKEKRKLRRILYSDLAIGFLILALFFVASAAWGVYGKYRETKEKRVRAEYELAELEERKTDIEKEIKRLESLRGVEEEIREKFGFVKKGEEVIIVVDPPSLKEDKQKNTQRSFLGAVLQSISNLFK